jgi:hypothetical protein
MCKWLVSTALVFLFVKPAGSRAQVWGTDSTTEQDSTEEQSIEEQDAGVILTCYGPDTGPELPISESVPYGFWFKILAHALNTNPDDPEVIARRQALLTANAFKGLELTPFDFVHGMSEIDPGFALHETRLSEVDQAVVKAEVLSWWKDYKRLEADEKAALAAGKMTEMEALHEAKADLTTATAQKLQTTLSPDGAAQFKTFIFGQCEAHFTIEQCKVRESWPGPNLGRLEHLLYKVEKNKPTADEKQEFRYWAERTLRECECPPNFEKRVEAALAGLR